MEFFTINRDTWESVDILNNAESKIWTERFSTNGEFKFVTKDISGNFPKIPRHTFIGCNKSNQVMEVETRLVTRDDNGVPTLTVAGKSLDDFFNHRHVQGPYGKRRRMALKYSPAEAAGVLMWNAVQNNNGRDVTRLDDKNIRTKDYIPNVRITDSTVFISGSRRHWRLQEGPLMPQLRAVLDKGDLGIRTIRPVRSTAKVVTVKTPLASKGEHVLTTTNNIMELCFDIYEGKDRSAAQTDREAVVFYWKEDEIDNPSYLYTTAQEKTTCEVMSPVGGADAYRSTYAESLEGFDRRVMSYDGGTPEDYPTQENGDPLPKSERDALDDEFREEIESEALVRLKRNKRKTIYTGDISPHSRSKYGIDYFLGDKVTLVGDYGMREDMIVNEYVYMEDFQGEVENPGFAEA